MVTVTREALMTYCRADGDEVGDLLCELADHAELYLSEQAGVDLSVRPERAALCVKALTLYWFDDPTGGELPAGLRQLINGLKYNKEES